MIKNYVQAEWKTHVEYELCFDDGHNNGYGFPCDANGNVLPLEFEAARKNLAYCKAHPDKFVRAGEVVTYRNRYKEPAHGTCICGQDVELFDQYYGACECPKCGRWYNLFGQELLPPDQWETDPSEEEYW
jgi:hypothetical protein